MKPVFKCDYCDFMGIEEKVKEHEEDCHKNYDKRSCFTCKNRKTYTNPLRFECDEGVEIPPNSLIEHCNCYERKEEDKTSIGNLFSSLFGGPFS